MNHLMRTRHKLNFKPPKIFISRKESEHTTVQEDRNIIAIYYK